FEIVKHASTVGARVFCGSSGVGWMYAMECLVVTPPLRVPMVALVGNRALDDPGAFGVEHNDALVVRDVGWLLCWIDTSQEALADFRLVFGRGPENPWFEEYMSDDADVILVGMGTISLPIKVAIRELRAKGKKVGLVRLRWFRPFPTEKLVAALSKAKAVGI